MVGMLGAAIVSGRLVTRWGRYKIFPMVGTACMTIGAYLMSLIGEHTGAWVMAGYMFVFGIGLGLIMQVLVVAVQNAVSYQDLGVATVERHLLPHDRRLVRYGGLRRRLRQCLRTKLTTGHRIASQDVAPKRGSSADPRSARPCTRCNRPARRSTTRSSPASRNRCRRSSSMRGAHRLRRLRPQLAPARARAAQDGPDRRHRGGYSACPSPFVARGDRAGPAALRLAGEPGRALPDPGPSGRARPAHAARAGCSTACRTSRPAPCRR